MATQVLLKSQADRILANDRDKTVINSRAITRLDRKDNPSKSKASLYLMAEEEGFEPPGPLRAQRFSRPPVSTAHALLRFQFYQQEQFTEPFVTLGSFGCCVLVHMPPKRHITPCQPV